MKRAPATGVLAVLIAIAATAGCAHDVRVNYPRPAAPGIETGSVTVRLTRAVGNLTMTVNGLLVAEGKHTKKVTVYGVPAGPAHVDVAMGGGQRSRVERRQSIIVRPGADTAVPIASPEMSGAAAVYWGLVMLGEWIFLASIYTGALI